MDKRALLIMKLKARINLMKMKQEVSQRWQPPQQPPQQPQAGGNDVGLQRQNPKVR